MRFIQISFDSFINEELQRTKALYVSKLDLENICNLVDLPYEEVQFLSSGIYGNAYRVGNKVLKITTDKSEAKSVYQILQSHQQKGIVKYYDISMYKMRNEYVYIIIMDYIEPLIPKIKKMRYHAKNNLIDFAWCLTDTIFYNWGKLDKKQYLEQVASEYVIPTDGFDKVMLDGIWKLYNHLKTMKTAPDFHPNNIGVDKKGNFVMFDFSTLDSTTKFDQPRII